MSYRFLLFSRNTNSEARIPNLPSTYLAIRETEILMQDSFWKEILKVFLLSGLKLDLNDTSLVLFLNFHLLNILGWDKYFVTGYPAHVLDWIPYTYPAKKGYIKFKYYSAS